MFGATNNSTICDVSISITLNSVLNATQILVFSSQKLKTQHGSGKMNSFIIILFYIYEFFFKKNNENKKKEIF